MPLLLFLVGVEIAAMTMGTFCGSEDVSTHVGFRNALGFGVVSKRVLKNVDGTAELAVSH